MQQLLMELQILNLRIQESTAIKIKTEAQNGVATVSIYGIKEDEEYQISFVTEIISTIPYEVKYVNDSTLKSGEGQEVIKQR